MRGRPPGYTSHSGRSDVRVVSEHAIHTSRQEPVKLASEVHVRRQETPFGTERPEMYGEPSPVCRVYQPSWFSQPP